MKKSLKLVLKASNYVEGLQDIFAGGRNRSEWGFTMFDLWMKVKMKAKLTEKSNEQYKKMLFFWPLHPSQIV